MGVWVQPQSKPTIPHQHIHIQYTVILKNKNFGIRSFQSVSNEARLQAKQSKIKNSMKCNSTFP